MSARDPAWTQAAPGVQVRQSSAYRMNSVLVEAEGGVLLVDPGVFPLELEDIARRVEGMGEVRLLFTHSHWDHVLGRLRWPAAPLVAHACFRQSLEGELDAARARVGELAAEFHLDWGGEIQAWGPDVEVGAGQTWSWRGRRLAALHVPGHARDQIALHLPGSRALCSADTLSDVEIPILAAGCEEYLASLERLRAPGGAGAVEVLVPGHGGVARGWPQIEARLERDHSYLEALRELVRDARRRGQTLEETQERASNMEGLGGPANRRIHRENVAVEWRHGGGSGV